VIVAPLAVALSAVGAGGAALHEVLTVKPFVSVPVWVSGFVTVTLYWTGEAVPLIVMLAVSCVIELNVHEFTVMLLPKLHVAPL
jgi:hypothetical protein